MMMSGDNDEKVSKLRNQLSKNRQNNGTKVFKTTP